VVLKSVIEHGDRPLNHWMQATFDCYWFGNCQWVTQWTNMLSCRRHTSSSSWAARGRCCRWRAPSSTVSTIRARSSLFADPVEADRFLETRAAAA
jgi:hypothetical protein